MPGAQREPPPPSAPVVTIVPVASSVATGAEAEPPPSAEGEPEPCPPDRNQTPAERPERIKASHILIAFKGARRSAPGIVRSRQQARALAQQVLQRLCQGARFEDMVRRHSDEPGADERAGSLGFFKQGWMVQPFNDAAFSLLPGELSPVVETAFGVHVIHRAE